MHLVPTHTNFRGNADCKDRRNNSKMPSPAQMIRKLISNNGFVSISIQHRTATNQNETSSIVKNNSSCEQTTQKLDNKGFRINIGGVSQKSFLHSAFLHILISEGIHTARNYDKSKMSSPIQEIRKLIPIHHPKTAIHR